MGKTGLAGRLPRALAREPAPFVAANSTYSLRLRQSPSEGRPALAGRSTSLPWGHRPHFGGRARQNRQTSPASFFSSPLPFWLGAYCHLQGPPKSVDFGRKTGPGGPLNEFALGPQAPFWRKGTPKTGKHRPPHFSVCLSPFGLAPTVIYRAHPSLWTSEGRSALAGRSSSLPWGHRPHFGERARQKPANVARLIFQFASPPLAWRLLSFTGPTQVCGLRKEDRPDGRSSSLPWGPQAPILAKGHAKNRQTSPASCFSSRAYRFR